MIAPALLVAGSIGFTFPSTARAQGGTTIWTFQGIEDINAADEIRDRDYDGVKDIVVETYDAGASGDHLYMLSGASAGAPSVIWSKKPVGGLSSGGGDGDQCLAVAPDMTGNGREDILLATAWGGRSAYVVDADTGRVVWDFDTYTDTPPNPAESGWVYQIVPVPDLTGDGISEVAFACGSDNNSGYVVDGQSGAVLWHQQFFDAAFTCTVIPDFTPDDDPAVVYGTGDADGKLYCVTGNGAGGIEWVHDPGGTVFHCTTISDISSDGIDDVIAATWNATVVAVSGADGDTLWTYDLGVGNNGMRVAILDDVNNDGVADVAAASWDNAAHVISGDDGTQIWRSETGTFQGGDVWAIDRVGDISGDGKNDVVAGSFDENVWAFNGASGETLWTTAGGGRRVFTVRGISDLTGNGAPDVLSGTQMLSGNGGKLKLIEGALGDVTAVGGPALAFARSENDGVLLSWEGRGEPASVDVWRATLDADERSVTLGKRAELLEQVGKGTLSARDVVRAIRDGRLDPAGKDEGDRFTRINSVSLDGALAGEYLDTAVTPGRRYAYRLVFTAQDGSGLEVAAPAVEIVFTGRGARSMQLGLLPNEPNPFRSGTTIRWSLPVAGPMNVAVYNAAGERVRLLVDENGTAGVHEARWDGRDQRGADVASGVYFYRLSTPTGGETRRMTLLR